MPFKIVYFSLVNVKKETFYTSTSPINKNLNWTGFKFFSQLRQNRFEFGVDAWQRLKIDVSIKNALLNTWSYATNSFTKLPCLLFPSFHEFWIEKFGLHKSESS